VMPRGVAVAVILAVIRIPCVVVFREVVKQTKEVTSWQR
jgi:hypothetical protein